MDKISVIIQGSYFNTDDFLVPPLEKPKDTRGFIYIVRDLQYTDLLKVGRTTDFVKRVQAYNNDRPYEDVIPVLCTRMISNAPFMEAMILTHLKNNYPSMGKSKEWFNEDCLQDILMLLEKFNHSYRVFDDDFVDKNVKDISDKFKW